MRKILRIVFIPFLVLSTLSLSAQSNGSLFGADLEQAIREGQAGPFQVFILMEDRVDVLALGAAYEAEHLPLSARSQDLIPKLQAKAAQTQVPILSIIQNATSEEAESMIPFWITNAIYAELTLSTLQTLDQESSIETIDLMPIAEIAEATPMPAAPEELMGAGGHELSLDIIKANKLWALGYTGNGRKAYIIDTGTDPNHPALARSFVGNYEGVANGWFGLTSEPTDCDNHGTHVAGTILGVDRETKDTIGVAPNGLWMASPAIECSNGPGATQALQWAINPDGDASTTSDMPDAINNSWRYLPSSWGCNSPVQQAITALEAVGVAVICAAGNDYPDYSVGGPAYANFSLVNAFAVGAISPTSPTLGIASFSSRGPSECGGTGALEIKPEVVAPGVGIRSAVRGNGYAVFQGTSMASPHVAGAVLLLKEAFPSASGTEIKFALYNTAIDLGDPGEDNTYGNGLIDVEAAYYYMIGEGFTPAPVNRNHDGRLSIEKGEPCGLNHEPEIYLENVGEQDIIIAELIRVYNDGVRDTINWSGMISPGMTETITATPRALPQSGRYTVDLSIYRINGVEDPYFIDNWDSYSFTALSTFEPAPKQLNVCIGSQGFVEAEIPISDPNATIHWYDQAEGGTLLGTGEGIETGELTGGKIFYLAPARSFRLGPEPSTSQGGFFDSGIGGEVVFDVDYPITIETVKVLAEAPGNRTIQIRNEQGTVLASKIVELPAGVSEVELGFRLERGAGYRMKLGFSMGGLWIQTIAPSDIGIPGVMSLVNSQAGQTPYFFDWKVSYELPCERTLAFVTVSPGALTPVITADPGANRTVQLSGSPSGGQRYRWFLGDGEIKEGRQISHQYVEEGVYELGLLVTGTAYCSDYTTQSVTIGNVSSLTETSFWEGILVYPNPTQSTLTVEWEGNEKIQAELFDISGRQISDTRDLSASADRTTWDLNDYPSGIFWLRVIRNGRVSIKKVVKS